MRKTVLFANQKGGVGKTTCCRELGLYLGSIGLKVLLIDADPQANLTNGLLEQASHSGLFDALTGQAYHLQAYTDQIDVLCADHRLSSLSKSLVGEIDGYSRLKSILQEERFNRFDYIFIDSRPAFDTLTLNGLNACTDVIIPMNPREYTLQGTNDLLESIRKVKQNFNPLIKITGIIINAYDKRPVIVREIKDEILAVFGEKVFASSLSKTIKIEEAISQKRGVTALEDAGRTRIAGEVRALGNELLQRLKG